MKMRQLLLCLMSFLFVMAQAQPAQENNFLTLTTGSNTSKAVSYKKKAPITNNKVLISKTIDVATAGTLSNMLTSAEKSSISELTITGNLDARDFKHIRDSLPQLEVLDISAVNILTYSGTAGPYTGEQYTYPANEIPAYAFCKMDVAKPNTTLRSIVFPATANSIGLGAFALCTGFSSLNIPASIASIKSTAFVGFYGSFTVDSNNLNYSALDGILLDKNQQTAIQCPSSKSGSYVISSSIKTIGEYAFYGCTLLNSINISSSVSSIESYAFFNCTGLTSMSVNNSPEKITMGSYCFTNLNTSNCVLHVPFGTKTLFVKASQWSDFTNIAENEHGLLLNTNSIILSNNSSTSQIVITTNDVWSATSDQTWITLNKTSGSGGDTIEISASANTTNENRIATITFSIDGIDYQTLTITQAGLPKTVNTTAGGLSTSMTASELSSVINIKLTGTLDARDFKTMRDKMPKLAFLDLSEVSIAAYSGTLGTRSGSVTYPVNTIPEYAFNTGMSNPNVTLTNVVLPNTITAIGANAFYSCRVLSDIVIPNSVTSIGSYAFGSCNSLTSIKLPDFVTSISSATFQNCISLTTVSIGSSVVSIGGSAFSGCTKLKNIDIPNSVTLLDNYSFAYCNNLDSVRIGNSVTTIGSNCFQSCSKLSNVIIPNAVTKIGSHGFASCINLKTISLGNGIKTIESYAFSSCKGLSSITVSLDTPVDLNSFTGVFTGINTTTCVLNVPFGTKSAYTSATQWKDFNNIIENTLGFALESNIVKIGYTDGSNAIVNISSNNTWSVSSDQLWLKVSPDSGAGNNQISLTADVNPTNLTRTAYVTVSATGTNSKTITVIQAASPKIITITAGGLATALTSTELSTLSTLTINGTIDSRDFKTMRDNMPQLAYIDISAANIVAYTGAAGTIGSYTNSYLANQIPQNAFSTTYTGKLSLISVILPTSANSIGNFAFQFCSGLTTLVIPESVTAIGYYAFASCSSLNNITLPSSLKKIESYTFSKCSKLTNIKIPELVTTISFNAFESCTSLTNIIIPNSVTLIDRNNFQYCSSLKEIVIPNSVTSIGSDAFASCSNLTNVTLSNSISEIAGRTFANCTQLTTITIPNSVKTIDTGAFQGCTKLETVNFGTTIQTLNYGVFQSCTSLKQITIPNTVTLMGNCIFMDCTALTDITIPNSVTSIGSDAFNGCKALKEISLPNSVTKLSLQTFANCSELKKVTLGSSLTSIESSAFYYCTNLDSIAIPNSVQTIGGSAFGYCTGLIKISLGNSLISIGVGGFMSCYALNNVTLPLSLKSIESSAFESCTSLTQITIPNSVTALGDYIFRNCDKLVKVINSNSIKNIPSMTFSGCSKLADINIGTSVVSIGELAFDYCVSLQNLTLPTSLQAINNYAFRYCSSLDKVSIPGSVTSIGESAFESCTGLRSITANALVPINIANKMNVFYNVDKTNCTLYVPYKTKSLYSSAGQWKDFVSIVENPHGLVLNTDSLNLSVTAGSNDTIHVTANTSWTVNSNQSWLSVSPVSGNDNGIIKVVAEANDLLTTRSAVVTVSASGIEDQTVYVMQDAATKNVTISAGGLKTALTHDEHTVLNKLTIAGTLDASDFRFMRDSIPGLTHLDISQTTIAAYTGAEGTGGTYSISYPAATIPQYAFYNTYSSNHIVPLKSIKLPSSITSIGNGAFEYCYKLDSVVIPNSVTTISDYAFENCVGMKSLQISNSLKAIGRVFGNCSSLTTVVIPNSVTSLAYGAFALCASLKNITLSNALLTIGGDAFYYCKALTGVVIPNSVTTIGSAAFTNCTALTSVIIGNSVVTIEQSAFNGCVGLTELILPKSVTTIGDYAFNGCNALKEIMIPEKVISIGSNAFNCTGLEFISSEAVTPIALNAYGVFSNVDKSSCLLLVPSGSASLYQAANQWKDFKYIIEDFDYLLSNDTVRIVSGASKTIDFPTTKVFTVTSDQTWLKVNATTETESSKIIIDGDTNPDNTLRTALVRIKMEFGFVKYLIVIQSGIPKPVTVSPGGLLSSLTKEELLTVSNLILTGTIDARDFRVMRDSMPLLADVDMKDVTITAYSGSDGTNPGVSSYPANEIPINAFYKTYSGVGKKTLASVILPDNITSIGKSAFAYAIGMNSVTIPDQVGVIGETAFAYCKGLKNVAIGNSVTTIGVEAFFACTKLPEVSLPNSVTTISKEGFSNCSSLKSISFSNNLTTIGTDAFVFCKSLTNVEIPNSVTSIETGAFRYCYKLERVVLPAALTELKYDVFYYCPLLKEIKLPETLKIIGPESFAYCTGLSTISIPASVNNIGYNAFSNCTSLSSIYAYPISPVDLSSTSLSSNVFNNVNKTTCTLYVPTGTKALYAAAIQWKDFSNIIEMNTAVPTLEDLNIGIYPNPVKEFLRIDGLNGNACVTLTDINGKVVLSSQINAGENISIGNLAKGVYIIRIITTESTIERKIIKE